ncbi:MAG: hypothetical protein VX346_19745 [Planctomycetota bacterium]|nr:hypothetical protein [Planctomycetota bacterium]
MYVQSMSPRRGQKLDLSSVVAVSGDAAGLESELLRDVLLLLRNQSRASTGEAEGTEVTGVLEDVEFVSQLTPERLLTGLGALPADPTAELHLHGLGPNLREKVEVALSTDDWTVLHRPVVTARGLADTTLLDLFPLRITYVARDAAPEIVATTSACSPVERPSNPLQLLQQVDDATRRAWEAGFAEVLPGKAVQLDDSPRITLTVRVGGRFPDLSLEPVERVRQLAVFPAIEESGAGCQQVAAVCLSLVLSPGRLVLLDEPAAHLNPTEAWRLGAWISRYARIGNNQLIIANNNPSFLSGLMAIDGAVTILEASTHRPNEPMKLVTAVEAQRMTESVLMSSESITSCLFSRRAVVVGTTEEKAIYERVAQRQFGRYDVTFIHSQSAPNLPGVMRELVAARIPVCVIAELELLGAQDRFVELVEAASTNGIESTWLGTCDRFTRMFDGPGMKTAAGVSIRQMENELLKISTGEFHLAENDETSHDDAVHNDSISFAQQKRKQVRENGLDAIDDEFRPWVEQLMDELRSVGVFLVGQGCLQSWIQFGTPFSRADWFFNALQEIDRGECPVHLETFVGAVLDYLDVVEIDA